MADTEFVDDAGVTRLRGTLKPAPATGIPQGGPLTQDLAAGGHKVTGLANPGAAQDADTRAARDAAIATRIPQGGPLTADLLTGLPDAGDFYIRGADAGDLTAQGSSAHIEQASHNSGGGIQLQTGDGTTSGGEMSLVAGTGNFGATVGAQVELEPGLPAAHGRAGIKSFNTWGRPGQTLVPDGADRLIYGTLGSLALDTHAAPADGDLAAGELRLWFDQTNGAGKLMVKAKTADGTVATAAIPLT